MNKYFLAKDIRTKIHFTSGYEYFNRIITDAKFDRVPSFNEFLSTFDVVIIQDIDKIKDKDGLSKFREFCNSEVMKDKVIIVSAHKKKLKNVTMISEFREIRKMT